jgi:hypothetical protein
MEPTLITSIRWRVLFAAMTRSGFPSHLAVTPTAAAASAGRKENPLVERPALEERRSQAHQRAKPGTPGTADAQIHSSPCHRDPVIGARGARWTEAALPGDKTCRGSGKAGKIYCGLSLKDGSPLC